MHRLWPDSLTLPFCQCASSKGSDETVRMLRRVWALTKNMPYVHPFCACAKAEKALAKLHKCSCASEHWLMKYTVCTPFLCMCQSSEGSGETARMLRFVWTLTDKICQKHTHFVYVREQWRLWQDCMHTRSRLSIDWKKKCHMYAHFVHVREQWRLWQDCTHAKARLSINWKNMPYVRPFCACVRAVKALVRLHAC